MRHHGEMLRTWTGTLAPCAPGSPVATPIAAYYALPEKCGRRALERDSKNI